MRITNEYRTGTTEDERALMSTRNAVSLRNRRTILKTRISRSTFTAGMRGKTRAMSEVMTTKKSKTFQPEVKNGCTSSDSRMDEM